jgi:hypothetical protein
MNIFEIKEGILKILSFRLFLAIFRSHFDQNPGNQQNFDLKIAKKIRKLKIFKIPSLISKIFIKSVPKTNFGALQPPRSEKNA